MKYKKSVKPRKSDLIVPDIDENGEDEEEDELMNCIVVPKKVNKILKKVQDDWVQNYIIN